MIDSILQTSGIPYRQGRFYSPPAETYAIYFDDQNLIGPDIPPVGVPCPLYVLHDGTIELYEPTTDPEAEAALEAALLAHGVTVWDKRDRYWLKDIQRYQVVYEISYTTKRRA